MLSTFAKQGALSISVCRFLDLWLFLLSVVRPKNQAGRPSKFSPELAAKIIEALKQGQTLEAAGQRLGIHRSALKRWLSLGRHASTGPHHAFFEAYHKIRSSPNGSSDDQPVGGRPLKPIDEKRVRKMAAMGLSVEQISAICECDADTISNRFSDFLKIGREARNGRLMFELVRRALAGKADPGSQSCLIFCAKSMLGLSDRPENDLRGNTGESVLRYIAELRQQHVLSQNGKEITGTERLELDSPLASSLDLDSDGAILDRDEPPPAISTNSSSGL